MAFSFDLVRELVGQVGQDDGGKYIKYLGFLWHRDNGEEDLVEKHQDEICRKPGGAHQLL